MASFNKVILLGNLTRDPEVRYTPKGIAVADLRLAVSRASKDKDKEEVCYIDVVVWERQAETCGEFLKKGSSVLVEGRLVYEEWESKDGKKGTRHRVVAERVQFMSGGTGGKGAPGSESPAAKSPEREPQDGKVAPASAEVSTPAGDTDDLPF